MGEIFEIAPDMAGLTFGRDEIFFILPTSPCLKKLQKKSSVETKFIKTMGMSLIKWQSKRYYRWLCGQKRVKNVLFLFVNGPLQYF